MLSTKFSPVLLQFSANARASFSNQGTKLPALKKRHISIELKRNYFNVNPPGGSGAGSGAGGGGSVRESGVLGQYGSAHEEEYFFNKRKEQLAKIRSQLKKEQKSPEIKRKEDK